MPLQTVCVSISLCLLFLKKTRLYPWSLLHSSQSYRKQHFTAVKYAKWLEQCLLFLVQSDEKIMHTLVRKLGWEGTESANVWLINSSAFQNSSKNSKTQRNMSCRETGAKREQLGEGWCPPLFASQPLDLMLLKPRTRITLIKPLVALLCNYPLSKFLWGDLRQQPLGD